MKFNLGKKLGTHEVDPVQVGKKIASSVAAYGTGVIIFSVIQKHLPEGMKLHTRLAVAMGTWAIVNVGKDKIREHTDKTIDDALDLIEKLKNGVAGFQEEVDARTTKINVKTTKAA